MHLCSAYVQPSFYEGFGCAVAEAMSVGAPIISSSAGGLGYLCANASLRVDPYNTQSICDALNIVSESASKRQALSDSAYNRAHTEFSYAKKVLSLKRILRQM